MSSHRRVRCRSTQPNARGGAGGRSPGATGAFDEPTGAFDEPIGAFDEPTDAFDEPTGASTDGPDCSPAQRTPWIEVLCLR
jgi:hypothetical protein